MHWNCMHDIAELGTLHEQFGSASGESSVNSVLQAPPP